MTRPLAFFAVCLAGLTTAAAAATIEGHLVNGTTNQPGFAQSVRLIDMAGGMDQIALLQDVTGDFRFDDVPATSGSPLILQVQSGDVLYSQPVQMTDGAAHVEFTVYDTTDALDAVRLDIFHVIFQRQHETMNVIELFEFDNSTQPPMAVWRDQGPIQLELPIGAQDVDCSVTAGRMPLNQELLETDEDGVYTIPYALKPGLTRVVVRYTVPYEGEALDWAPTMFHPVTRRSILVSPDDIQVTAAGLEPSGADHAPPAGYLALVGGALAAGETFAVRLEGGSEVFADPHAGVDMSGNEPAAESRIDIRRNRVHDARYLVLLGLSGLLMVTFLVTVSQSSPGPATSDTAGRLAHLEDGYVAGNIDRHTFEEQRRRLLHLPDPAPRRPQEPLTTRKG